MSSGLDWVFEHCQEAIAIEDDCLPHPDFFRYCEELLQRYRNEPRVMQICGTNVQPSHSQDKYSYYFSRYNHAWGWATWRRAWRLCDVKAIGWRRIIDSNKDYLTGRAERRLWQNLFCELDRGTLNDPFDCQWFLTLLNHNAFATIPKVTLISNLGFRKDATHTKRGKPVKATLSIGDLKHPPRIRWNREADVRFMRRVLNPPASPSRSPSCSRANR
jgi:hypothetical protein